MQSGENLYMPIDRERLEDHISRRGSLMFHVTAATAVPVILTEGLRPGSELRVSSKGGFFKTREGRVYLGDALSLAVVEVEGKRAYIGVDLSKLEPELIDPDEDQVQGSFDRRGGGWVAQPPPVNSTDADTEAAGQALAEWADATEGFDAPDVTAKSLETGRVAHRGTIKPSALTVVPFPSEGPELFFNGARNLLNDSDLDLAPPPALGFYKTEVARAIALARSLIASAAQSVDEPTDPLLLEWPHSEHANYTRDSLIGAARRRGRAGDLAQADILRAAQHVAQTVPDIQPELGWAATRDACVNVAQEGVDLIRCLQEHAGAEVAAAAAESAMAAVAAVPDQS
jgi:hypothetical protein